MEERLITAEDTGDDSSFDLSLRPKILTEYVGQNKVKENLKVFIRAARGRGESLDHVLFYGPPGLGKTTLAHIIAAEMGVNIRSTSGPVIEKPGEHIHLHTQFYYKFNQI